MEGKTLLPFISPTTICIVGPTQAGKSMFTKRLLENSTEMFTCPPVKILYAYSEYQKLFDEMQDIFILTFHEGLPDKQKLEEFSQDCKHTVLVLDDLVSKIVQSEELLHLFTVTSHHRNFSSIFISQNLYPPGKYAKSISLNCANFVLFRNQRDTRQIMTFASQLLSGKTRYFMESFFLATKQRYSYLLVDISPHRQDDSDYMLRTGIFPNDTCVVYRPT